MSGEQLRQRLTELNIGITDLAEKLRMTQPNLSAGLKVKDVKSGLLEQICEVTGHSIMEFYPEHNETIIINTVSRPSAHNLGTGSGDINENGTDSTVQELLKQNKALIEIIKNKL